MLRQLFGHAATPPKPPPAHNVAAGIVKDVERVRPLPTTANRVLQAMEDPNANAQHVANLLRLDQALAADALRFANSAAHAGTRPTASVLEAVARLGFGRVRALVLGAATAKLLTGRLNGYGMGATELWDHSVLTASLARYVAQCVRYPSSEAAYVAGLLHDIGKLVLDQYVRVDSNVLVELMHTHTWQLWQAEEKVFGMDHATVGGLMAEKWQFPTELVDAIRCHHWPSLARSQPELAAIVNLADALPTREAVNRPLWAAPQIHPETLRILSLDERQIAKLRAEMPWQPGA
jgi:putative nucleotidyltransferase with HDIG domain